MAWPKRVFVCGSLGAPLDTARLANSLITVQKYSAFRYSLVDPYDLRLSQYRGSVEPATH
jgi:hypothetical protein